jgi:rhodanese-related sulfurtransferase
MQDTWINNKWRFERMKNYQEQTTTEVFARIQNKEDIQYIDVRELDEWASGHIAQAKHIRLSEIPDRLSELDQNKEIILICRSGGRSSRACEFLAPLGYKVTNMQGGMLDWQYDTVN